MTQVAEAGLKSLFPFYFLLFFIANTNLEYFINNILSDEDHEGQGRMTKLAVKRFEWRSDELTRELKSLDRKANRARSERGKRMMVKREEGGFLANSLHCHPKSAPAWALSVDLRGF